MVIIIAIIKNISHYNWVLLLLLQLLFLLFTTITTITTTTITTITTTTVVRNPFTRVISEYHCEWGGCVRKNNNNNWGVSDANSWIVRQLKFLKNLQDKDGLIHGCYNN